MIYNLNIKQIFLENIKQGLKIHEYRLYNEKRHQIRINDKLNLIANENSNITLLVKVIGITIYSCWEDAINNTKDSLGDFKNIYNSKNEIIKECKKFYSLSDVEKYGIVVFDIQLANDF